MQHDRTILLCSLSDSNSVTNGASQSLLFFNRPALVIPPKYCQTTRAKCSKRKYDLQLILNDQILIYIRVTNFLIIDELMCLWTLWYALIVGHSEYNTNVATISLSICCSLLKSPISTFPNKTAVKLLEA